MSISLRAANWRRGSALRGDPGNETMLLELVLTDPTLSVIVVTWNDWPKLQVCLNSVFNSALPPTEVVVIDNASTDGTRERIRERFPAARVCRNERNIGHTKAVNLGFSLARGEFILRLDSDTELAPETVDR